MTLKLNGSTSGYVTIDAPAVAGTTAITLPAVSGGSFVVSDSSGNVGIGTNTPAYKLHVADTSTATIGSFRDLDVTAVGAASSVISIGARNGSTFTAGAQITGVLENPATTGYLTFSTRSGGTNSERMRIDSSGNVGIGTTSPSTSLQINKDATSGAAGGITIKTADSNESLISIGVSTSLGRAFISSLQNGTGTALPLDFITGNSSTNVRMRIDSSGNLLVGTATAVGAGNARATFQKDATGGDVVIVNANVSATFPTLISFRTQGTERGRVSTDGSTVTYNTTSDYRLKENVQPMTTGLATIGALKPVTYDWIIDKSKGEGFIAHELQKVVPLAVTGEKDAVDDEGNIQPQGVDYSKIVVHLVAAIQEQQTMIEDLKSRIAVLESK